jgi:hypothetical protein
VGRVLRLTLLAPDIVEAILNGRQPPEMTLAVLNLRYLGASKIGVSSGFQAAAN